MEPVHIICCTMGYPKLYDEYKVNRAGKLGLFLGHVWELYDEGINSCDG